MFVRITLLIALCSTIAFAKIEEPTEQKPGTFRLCKCSEVEECRSQMINKGISECKEECKNELEVFGNNTGEILTCFDHYVLDEVDMLDKCLRKNSSFCNSDRSTVKYIPQMTFYEALVFEQGLDDHIPPKPNKNAAILKIPLIKKAHETYGVFREFQTCVNQCLSGKTSTCIVGKK